MADARILVAVDCELPPGGPQYEFSALLDTGAQITSISRTVVEALADCSAAATRPPQRVELLVRCLRARRGPRRSP